MIKNVYVSYTRELAGYVDAAKTAIEGAGLEPLIFEEFRYRMSNLSPNEMMRRQLDNADVFIGIYACRYGGIPELDFEGQPNTEGKSYIDLEYSAAVALRIPRIICLLRREVDCPETDNEEGMAKLQVFVDHLFQREHVLFYGSIDELKIGLLMRLANLLRITPLFEPPSTDKQYRHDVFMVMPFANEYKDVYEQNVKVAVEALGLTIKRGDDFFANHAVIQDIWSAIARCRVVIGDCSGKNPNVFYELGVAHTLGKPTILLAQAMEDAPFDIQHLRRLRYTNTKEGLEKLRKELVAALRTILDLR